MLSKILSVAEANGFLKRIHSSKVNLEHIKLGPVGYLLKENLTTEWFYSVVLNKDVTVTLSDGDISDTFDYTKSMCSGKLPFAIAQKQNLSADKLIGYNGNVKQHVCVENECGTILKCSVFVFPSSSVSTFHQWQRQRKMWWRKFSAIPNRYSLTDLNTDSNSQNVEIIAKYPWGSQLVETLTLKESDDNFTIPQLQFKEAKRSIQAHTIISKINLSAMFLNSIYDAFDESTYQGKPRSMFRFHRKLAPYKIAFAISKCDAAGMSELNELCLYLSKQLRINHISTLLLPSGSKNTLELQYEQYDQLGIPYTVVVNEGTLKNGMIHLRSRDTTLKEQVHVTDLVTYVEQLFKDY